MTAVKLFYLAICKKRPTVVMKGQTLNPYFKVKPGEKYSCLKDIIFFNCIHYLSIPSPTCSVKWGVAPRFVNISWSFHRDKQDNNSHVNTCRQNLFWDKGQTSWSNNGSSPDKVAMKPITFEAFS